ncbi:protein Niban 2 [Oryzias melastigma]|uniref:Niban apoptosis regulator 2b n=2 Tax=Oryzias melastigma TaxID=30732 RepID=A0A3B3DBB1_ORYME|nr:protein Niban 2 [Oryzias melastigma]
MGDVVSSHLDETKRELITARTGAVMAEFGRLYEQQYGVALFNKVRFDLEGGGGPQSQLLQRKIPLENKSIFSGSIFQYVEENKKWRNRFLFVPDSYNISCYENKASFDKHVQPKGTINCAGSKVLTSVEQYQELISDSLPDVKAKAGSSPFLKCPSQFPVIVWHPYARHHYFCVGNEKEQQKWQAVLQDCVRHSNDGLCEENKVQTPAFTDAVRLYRQAQGNYGTWEMMCGLPSQILSNLVMESLHPELRELISPRLKGKLHDRQRSWMLISDAIYSLVQEQCGAHYEALLQKCEATRSSLEASIRKDMDQIIASKEQVTSKVKAAVLSKAEKLLKVSIQPYISSILDALMEPTSRGFFEVRDVFFRELTEMSKNTLNKETKETVAQHMEKISMLPYHPVKMQSCYEKVEQLSLEGLQQRFDVSSPSVFVQRAQILMRQQMDNAVFTFEHILHQSLESQGPEDLCKTIQRCQDRVLKKFDYDSSTVRKRFFREALLQIFIPYMLKQLSPTCASELPGFQELIFEDFCRFILVENIFEEVVLHSVMKDIMIAVKEAAVQRKHNLFRDSIVLSNSDPNLHLLVEKPPIDWARKYGGAQENTDGPGGDTENEAEDAESKKSWRMKQVVSMIQVEGSSLLPSQSSMEVPSTDGIREETDGNVSKSSDNNQNGSEQPTASETPPDTANGADLKQEARSDHQSEEDEAKDIQLRGEEQSASSKELKKALPLSPIAEEIPPGVPEVTPDNPSNMSNGTDLNQEGEGAVTAITDAKDSKPEAEEPPAPSKKVVESKPKSPTSEERPSVEPTPESASDAANGSGVKLEELGKKDEAEIIVNVGEVNITKKDKPEVEEPPSSQVVEPAPSSPADWDMSSSKKTPESTPDSTNGSETVQEAKPEEEAVGAAVTVTMDEDLTAKDTKSVLLEPPASSKEVVESKLPSPAAEALDTTPKNSPDNANGSDLIQDVKLRGTAKEDDPNDDGPTPAVNATMSEDIKAKDNKPEVEEPPSSQVVEPAPPSPADGHMSSSNEPLESAPAAAAVTEDLTATDSKPALQEPPASSKEVVDSKPPRPAAEAVPVPETPLETSADSSLPPLNSCTQSPANKAVEEGEAAASCAPQTPPTEEQLMEEETCGAAEHQSSTDTQTGEQ